MRKLEINIYKFNELRPEVQKQVLDKYRYINVEHESWWTTIEEEISNFGTLDEFDTYRYTIEIKDLDLEKFIPYALKNFGEKTALYRAASNYSAFSEEEKTKYRATTLSAISGLYLKMLEDEYETLMSDEAVIDTLEYCEYEFLEYGEKFYHP